MKRYHCLLYKIGIGCFFCCSMLAIRPSTYAQQSAGIARKYNVLFLFVDDLRPELGCYGSKTVLSPNIDRLASASVVFNNQYVTVPTCGASRVSILTGMRPRKTDDLSNDVLELRRRHSELNDGVPESFIEQFRNSGYYTVGIGKISHSPDGYIYKYNEPRSNILELPGSWNEMLFNAGEWKTGWNAFFGYAGGLNRNALNYNVKPYENSAVPDSAYPDGLTANLAVTKLRELSQKDQPFFLGVGFFKPHLPFNAPKKYWDLYDENNIPLSPSPDIPLNVNTRSLQESNEFNSYNKGDEKASLAEPLSEAYAKKIRHAYFASVSYIDEQIGRVVNELKRLGLEKNTIIVLWGDHGWHLGDERVWGKHTLSEWALRSPLIISAPGFKNNMCNEIVSSIDVYPTLMELCGLKMNTHTDGKSLVPLLRNPKEKKWTNVAYSYYNKGISARTGQYRISFYFRPEEPHIELYDYANDPYERINIAKQAPLIKDSLLSLIEKGNTSLYQQKKKQNQDGL